jgi:hypothetical protein
VYPVGSPGCIEPSENDKTPDISSVYPKERYPLLSITKKHTMIHFSLLPSGYLTYAAYAAHLEMIFDVLNLSRMIFLEATFQRTLGQLGVFPRIDGENHSKFP